MDKTGDSIVIMKLCNIPKEKEIFRAQIWATEKQGDEERGEEFGKENSQGSRILMNWSLDVVGDRRGREVCGDPQVPGWGKKKVFRVD